MEERRQQTGHHRVCGVASPDGERVVEMASDHHIVRRGRDAACIDGGRVDERRYERRSRESDESDWDVRG